MYAKCNSNNEKTPKFFHLTRVTLGGGGGQDGKWSHFPPFFFWNPSLKDYVKRQSELKRTMSESDLTCMVGDENSIKAGESKSAPTPQTIKKQ